MSAFPSTPGDHWLHLEHAGRRRRVLLRLPPRVLEQRPLPLVLALHGSGSNAREMVHFSGLSDHADQEGFAVAYPEGTGRLEEYRSWNAGHCCGYAAREGVDDVGFLEHVLDCLAAELPLAERVCLAGMSSGGMMAYRFAVERAPRVAAVAAVAAAFTLAECAPQRPVPVLHFHGTLDEFVPYAGGLGSKSLSRTRFCSVENTLAAWIAANGCPAEPHVEPLPDVAGDGTQVTRFSHGPGRGGSEVVLYRIEGAAHTWPGRVSRHAVLGPTTANLDATAVIAAFFARHRPA